MSEYVYATSGGPVANVDGSISLAREEVVRCCDCAFSRVFDGERYPGKKYKGMTYCICWGDMQADWTKPDGFCHKGERKKEGDDGLDAS